MKTYYTISEIGKLLGLTTDAIRFYEKKGLVHPKLHPHNHYRMYHLDNVLELLDIIYYRHLDIPMKDICEMASSLNPTHVLSLLDKKVEETRRKIWYEQQLLKKLIYIKSFYSSTEQQSHTCELKQFPKSLVLFEGESKESFFQHEIKQISADEFVLCSIFRTYHIKDMQPQKTYVTLESDVLKDLALESAERKRLENGKCVYMRIKMVHREIPPGVLDYMTVYGEKHHLKLSNTVFVREIPFTFYHDKENYYAELYIPLAQ